MKGSMRKLAHAVVAQADAVTPRQQEALAQACVDFLAQQRGLSRWQEFVRAIEEAWRKKFGVANVRITSAHPLSKDAVRQLEKAFPHATVTCTVDPTLVGGAVVQVDDMVLDDSADGRLRRLKQQLVA